MKKIVTFGEIMLRLSTPGLLRFGQSRSFDVVYGGGESNVAVSLSNYGLIAEFVTRLPENDIGEACLQFLRQYNVGTDYIVRGGARLGIYFLETGSVMRASQVIYDRENSSFATIQPGLINWREALYGAQWFHWTGITPAISENAALSCLEGIRAARDMGLTISCDLNYRAKLWKWGKEAGEVMREMVSLCDLAVGNEEDAEKVFDIAPRKVNVTQGKVSADSYQSVCEELAAQFPSLKRIAFTLRGSYSANHNTWGGVLWDQGKFFTSPIFDITHIVDRVGTGDSFVGGLVFGLLEKSDDLQWALNFAVAASALKHTVAGDFNLVTREEVENLVRGNLSGRINR